MSSPFILDDARPITPSEGGFSNESNVEYRVSDQAARVPEEEALHWYGKQVFAFRLASNLIRQAKENLTSDELDVSAAAPCPNNDNRRYTDFSQLELCKHITRIPCLARLETVNDITGQPVWGGAGTSRAAGLRAYYIAIGALANSEDYRISQSLDSLIQPDVASREGSAARTNAQYTTGLQNNNIGGPVSPDAGSTQNDKRLAYYSMALKEHGDTIGREPRYDIEPSSVHPSQFRARVSVNGSIFDGEASTKKQAKHLASKEACRALGIAV